MVAKLGRRDNAGLTQNDNPHQRNAESMVEYYKQVIWGPGGVVRRKWIPQTGWTLIALLVGTAVVWP